MYPRRAHWPIVVPDTPTSSPASPARKRPWGRSSAMPEGCFAAAPRASVRRSSAGAPTSATRRTRRARCSARSPRYRDEARGRLAVREVARALEHLEPAPGDRRVRGAAVVDRDDRVSLAPHDERREVGGEVQPAGRRDALAARVDRRAGGAYERGPRAGVGERADPGRDAGEVLAGAQAEPGQDAAYRAARRSQPRAADQGEHELGAGERRGAENRVHFATEPPASDQHEPLDAFGELVGELHRGPAAERVADTRGRGG